MTRSELHFEDLPQVEVQRGDGMGSEWVREDNLGVQEKEDSGSNWGGELIATSLLLCVLSRHAF